MKQLQRDRRTDRQTDGQTDRQANRQADRQTGRQTDRLKLRMVQTDPADRQTDRQAGRQTDRQTGDDMLLKSFQDMFGACRSFLFKCLILFPNRLFFSDMFLMLAGAPCSSFLSNMW